MLGFLALLPPAFLALSASAEWQSGPLAPDHLTSLLGSAAGKTALH
jgi:hypothetical protein